MHTEQDLCPINASRRSEECAPCLSRSGGMPPCARRWLELRTQMMRLPDEPLELPAAA